VTTKTLTRLIVEPIRYNISCNESKSYKQINFLTSSCTHLIDIIILRFIAVSILITIYTIAERRSFKREKNIKNINTAGLTVTHGAAPPKSDVKSKTPTGCVGVCM